VRTISLKLPDSLLDQLEKEARTRRVTKSRLVRESLEQALSNRHSSRSASCFDLACFDLACDLAGVAKGLPEDLAENPKYMQGFGQ
jgi:hypothetical protein